MCSGKRRDLIERIGGAGFRRLGDGDGHRLAAMHEVRREAADGGGKGIGRQLAGGAVDRHELGTRREKFRRVALVDIHMGLAVAEHLSARPVEAGERQRIGRRARADEEDGDVTLEDFGKGLFHTLVEVTGAIGRGEAVGRLHEASCNGGMGACPVVGSEKHAVSCANEGRERP
jgi:hypothetical protein